MNAYESNKRIADNIKTIIRKKGILQSDLAQIAGYSRQQLNNMLQGRKLIRADDIPRIADALSLTPNDLYNYQNSQNGR